MTYVVVVLQNLHNGSSMPIVHCDLKPTNNFLLDLNMVGHLTTFEIGKLFNRGDFLT